MNLSRVRNFLLLLLSTTAVACNASKQQAEVKLFPVTVMIVESKDVTIAQQYLGRVRSQRNLKVQAPEAGVVERVLVKAGQEIEERDVLFQFRPTKGPDFQAEACGTQLERITAPFDGTVGPVNFQPGSHVEQGDVLTYLLDNSVMQVYFDVPERRYLEHMAEQQRHKSDLHIELATSNGETYDQPGTLAAIEADFDGGKIQFRADFPNPNRQLRHGQNVTISLGRIEHDAIAIPQRATFELLNKHYVYVVDKNDLAHRREIFIEAETDDIFVLNGGLVAGEKIVVNGVRTIRDGDKVKYDSQTTD